MWKKELDSGKKLCSVIQSFPEKFVEKEGLRKVTLRGKVLVVPDAERINALIHVYEIPESGHFGVRNMLKKAQERCYWPEMLKDMKHHLKTCDICATRKDSPSVPVPPMKVVNISCFTP